MGAATDAGRLPRHRGGQRVDRPYRCHRRRAGCHRDQRTGARLRLGLLGRPASGVRRHRLLHGLRCLARPIGAAAGCRLRAARRSRSRARCAHRRPRRLAGACAGGESSAGNGGAPAYRPAPVRHRAHARPAAKGCWRWACATVVPDGRWRWSFELRERGGECATCPSSTASARAARRSRERCAAPSAPCATWAACCAPTRIADRCTSPSSPKPRLPAR